MKPVSRVQARAEALQVLGLSPNANPTEIREAWRKIAFQDHPDHAEGDISGFSDAKAAYDFLRNEGMTRKGPGHSSAPRRPRLKKRVIMLAAEEIEACRDLLKPERALTEFTEHGAAGATDRAGDALDHVPDAIGCFGRDITYFVASSVREGQNRIALPTSVLSGHRKTETEVLTFQSKGSGAGEIIIPDPIRARKFPGAKSVKIRFQADQNIRDMFELAG